MTHLSVKGDGEEHDSFMGLAAGLTKTKTHKERLRLCVSSPRDAE